MKLHEMGEIEPQYDYTFFLYSVNYSRVSTLALSASPQQSYILVVIFIHVLRYPAIIMQL